MLEISRYKSFVSATVAIHKWIGASATVVVSVIIAPTTVVPSVVIASIAVIISIAITEHIFSLVGVE